MENAILNAAATKTGQEAAVIALKSVGKHFGDFRALNNVDLDVFRGEKIIICGPSGSGKSTLIRCINRIEKHDEGRISVNGHVLTEEIKDIAAVRRDVGMVFQSFNLFPHLSILENCMLAPVQSRGVSKKEAKETAMHFLAKVRIPEQAHKYPGQLSGGQQQRVAIARALCMKPQVMLFDEPTSALDPEMVKEVLDTMVGLAAEGMTMICVTHEMAFAREVADRVVFMDKGTVVEQDAPDGFFSAPKSGRAREFLRQIIR
ncbi:glutamine ABC transporter ATP-binding protein [Rhizobium leguminosarum bv. trifolii]|uniref:Glutamine ABC transporter ATP-binding protein n=2 Tax=Rhizobium leguminosarum TaxID=384 RepID=A0A3E1BF93_RHILT|nr:amino acid ABC transporter ATP-binding protein [Rhizobium leguminosarum]RFB90689.1 glutamine ABC transporter ATP-binding protein [Rhizobium leguminosarum bv. trifolii]RFB91061.1 glutamine ABC transporter ATP-binding protein [Rhizobium leguminosarum bv. trifolii]